MGWEKSAKICISAAGPVFLSLSLGETAVDSIRRQTQHDSIYRPIAATRRRENGRLPFEPDALFLLRLLDETSYLPAFAPFADSLPARALGRHVACGQRSNTHAFRQGMPPLWHPGCRPGNSRSSRHHSCRRHKATPLRRPHPVYR